MTDARDAAQRAHDRREAARHMIRCADRILADIDAKMAACPLGHRCCKFRNSGEDDAR